MHSYELEVEEWQYDTVNIGMWKGKVWPYKAKKTVKYVSISGYMQVTLKVRNSIKYLSILYFQVLISI